MSRETINQAAGSKHELAQKLLGLDWYDVESQARTVIEAMAEYAPPQPDHSIHKPCGWQFKPMAGYKKGLWIPCRDRDHMEDMQRRGLQTRPVYAQPLDTVQGDAQAKVTLSSLLADLPDGYSKDDVAFGWNECVDNYTHAEAGEVEWLREELQERRELDKRHIALIGKRDEMKQRLATAECFVRGLRHAAGNQSSVATGYLDDILDRLAASAKPEGGEE